MGLGKLRIECRQDGNLIQIYNSPTVCSLVINYKVVAQYAGMVAPRFVLKGEVHRGDDTVLVEAKMGICNMRLFYNGVQIAKKFMAFG